MKTAGIDFSSFAVDLVTIDADSHAAEWRRYPLNGADAFDRTRHVRDAMPPRTAMIWDDIEALAIEHPAGKQGTGVMMRLQGAILACLPRDLLVTPLPPSAWRKHVGLSGRASKEDVEKFAKTCLGMRLGMASDPWRPPFTQMIYFTHESPSQDACDAFCLALAVSRLVERPAVVI